MTKSGLFLARPKWSLKSSFFAALGILSIVTIVVLLILKESVWTELEVITLILAGIIFLFLTHVLYYGVRFDTRERVSIDWPKRIPDDLINVSDYVPGDTFGFFTQIGAEEGIAGIIIGFILDLFVTIILAFIIAALIWLGYNIFIIAIGSISLPLFYFYRRALRGIVVRGRKCRGNLGRSAIHALASSTGYAIWFYLIFFVAHWIQQMPKPL
jgi:hypothetical protein